VNRRTAAALASFAILMAGTTGPTAMFVVYRDVWRLSTADLGIVFAAYVLTLLPVLLLFGGIADRIGRRNAVAVGVVFAFCGIVTLALAPGLGGLIAARLLQGVAVGIASGALTAAISETHRGALAPGTWTVIASATGIFAGPLVTAIAFDLGAGVHAAYLPLIVLTAACAVLVTMLAPRAPSASAADFEEPYSRDVVARALAFGLAVTVVSWTGVSLYLSMVPAFLAATLRAHDPLAGAIVIAMVQTASIVATLRVRSIVPARDGIVAPAVVLAGLIALVAGTSLHGAAAWALVALSTVLVGGAGGVAFTTGVVIATRVCRGQRARIFARLFVAAYLAFSVPTLAVGVIAARASLAAGFIAVIVVLAALVAALPALRARAALDAIPE
jgi:MFS family permease